MKLEPNIISYFIMAYVISIIIVIISSMTIHVTNNHEDSSDSFKNTVKGVGGMALAASLGVLIAAPTISFPKDNNRILLAIYLFAVFLAGLMGALASISIDSMSKLPSETATYKTSVRIVGGFGIMTALIAIIGGPIYVLKKDKRVLAMVLVAMLLASLTATVSGMGVHSANIQPSDGYKKATRVVAGVALTGALVGLVGIPLMAYKMKQKLIS